MKPHVKLFIPGPVEVSEDTFHAMSQPMIGHRGSGFQELYASIQPKLQQVLYTKNPVFISTSSAWGVMEAAVRNLVARKVLNCCCGAFSDKWFDVSKRCGKDAEALKVDWGQPILPESIDAKLKTGQFDAITVVHNETSTGLMNPLADIAQVMRKYPDVTFIVDTVSSMTGVKIETDALGIDVILAGTQKAWALPPGLAVFAVSEKALKKAATIPGRGYYFDFVEFKANHDKNMTPSTPSITHIYGLKYKLEQFEKEGLENRYARHRKMAQNGPRLGEVTRVRVVPESRLRVAHAHVREEQQEHRRGEAPEDAQGQIHSCSSTVVMARSKARVSASATWATKPPRPSRI